MRPVVLVGALADRGVGLVVANLLGVPQLGELEGAGAVAVGFLDLDEQALEVAGVVVGLVEGKLNALAVQFILADNAGPCRSPARCR